MLLFMVASSLFKQLSLQQVIIFLRYSFGLWIDSICTFDEIWLYNLLRNYVCCWIKSFDAVLHLFDFQQSLPLWCLHHFGSVLLWVLSGHWYSAHRWRKKIRIDYGWVCCWSTPPLHWHHCFVLENSDFVGKVKRLILEEMIR